MTKAPTTKTDSRPGVTVYMPDHLNPKLVIPFEITKQWMMYGRIGYEDHKSEWGCAVKLRRDDEHNVVFVEEWEPYKIDASSAYWESIDGERQRHADEIIAAGKEDELQYWNGLFHTHPIGSGASMSGTDKTQLEDMASGGHWAISIICPANREGEVIDNKFMYHYADSRPGGMFVCANLKPTIGSPPITEEIEVVRTHMKDLMVKVEKTPPAKQIGSGSQYPPRTLDDDYGAWGKWDSVRPYAYDKGTRDEPHKGDWVYVDALDESSYAMSQLSEAEKAELAALPGLVGLVIDDTAMGHITVDCTWHEKIDHTWILDPKMTTHGQYGDDVLVVARDGSLDDRVISRGIFEHGIDPLQMGVVRDKLRQAGITAPPYDTKNSAAYRKVWSDERHADKNPAN
jgi:hypothetical protein